jgi:TRAP-type C4-dicarboxylate transport system permease small subunit
MMKIVTIFDDILEKLSRWGIVFCLFTILGFAVSAIVLRWMGMSNMWIEPLTRHLVFLSAFFGGSLATSKDVHIKVDALTKLVERSRSKILHFVVKNLVTLFCFVTTFVLMKTSWDFFLIEKEFGAPSFLNIHSAYLVGIIPFGMGLIMLRFLNRLIIGIFNGDQSEPHRVH